MVMQITIFYHPLISSDPALLGSKQLVRHWTPNLWPAMSSKASTSALGQVDSSMDTTPCRMAAVVDGSKTMTSPLASFRSVLGSSRDLRTLNVAVQPRLSKTTHAPGLLQWSMCSAKLPSGAR